MARSKFEIKAQKDLEAQGWKVDYKIRPSGFRNPSNYNVDYFNLFDLMAYKPGIIRLISIKGTMGILKEHQEAIRKFIAPRGVTKEIWQYRKLAGKRIFTARQVVVPNS